MIDNTHRYSLQVCKSGQFSYFIVLNNSVKEVEIHRLSDGGILLSYDGLTSTTYMKEMLDQYRFEIGSQSCVFQKEVDPSILRSPSAGKLINLLVNDGMHLNKGEPYAEIEVMKMVMTLKTNNTGVIKFKIRPGSVLKPETIIAHFKLDDSSVVPIAQPFSLQFPNIKSDSSMETLARKLRRY